MKPTLKRLLFVFTLVAFLPSLAGAHSRFNPAGNIPGRTTASNGKTAPCAGVARTANPKILTGGTQVRVDWEETINHPGYYEIYFSAAGDANFILLATIPDTQDMANNLPHAYNAMVTLPSGTCTDCTLQLIQVMTENNPPTRYYSCADIQLSSVPTPAPTPVPTPAPAPSPSPSPNPNSCH